MTSSEGDSESDTVFCTNCGEEIAATASFCTECGTEREPTTGVGQQHTAANGETDAGGLRHRLPGISTNNPTRRNVLIGIGYSIAGLAALGAASGGEDPGTGDRSNSVGNSDSKNGASSEGSYPNAWYVDDETSIVLRNVEGTVGKYSVEITGEAINDSGHSYEYVQLSFGLYDETDAKVGDALANTSGLSAGTTWRFEAIGSGAQNAESFRIEDITAY